MNIEERLKQEKIIKCPKCKDQKMVKIVSPNKKFIVDECHKCRGRFLDRNEITSMKDMTFFEYAMLWFKK